MRMAIACALAAAVASGCMLAPTDGQVVSSTTAPVAFGGAVFAPGQGITVRAFDFQARAWTAVASTTSAAGVAATFGKAALYGWRTTVPLDARFWLAGFPSGFGARVQAANPSGALMSVEASWNACAKTWDDPGQFALHCASDHTPAAWIATADFVPPVVRKLDVRRYTTAELTDADADRILADATVVLQELDTEDLRCGEELERKAPVSVFATGDGSIDSDTEFAAVRNLPGEVMIVNDINWCGGLVPNVIGCASGDSFAAVRLGSREGILWAHEHGHTRGLPHRTSDYAIMNPVIRTTARGVNATECAAYAGP